MSPTRSIKKAETLWHHVARCSSDPNRASLGAILAMVAVSDFDLLESYLKLVLEKGLDPGHIGEVLLEAHLFAGFPRAINGLGIFAGILEGRGWALRAFQDAEPIRSGRDRRRRGKKLFRAIYGKNTTPVLNSLHSLHPLYDRWILEDAYGRVLSRPFLPGVTRELCAVAALTVTGVPKQLKSHIVGAINLGASPGEIKAIVQAMEPLADQHRMESAHAILASLNYA